MQNSPKFIVLEGIDGSGKTTLAKNLETYYLQNQIPVKRFFEPTDLESGQYIRKFLRGEIQLRMQEQIKAFINDRKISVNTNILPTLQSSSSVILDRYYYSTAAYQAGKEFTPSAILKANQYLNFPKPDILFFLKIEPQTAMERIQSRVSTKERFDSLELLEKIHQNFLSILPPETIFLDATLPEDVLLKEAISHISL
jgi:dTMP kinase